MSPSKSERIRSLLKKGLSKAEIAGRTGYSPQLIHIVYTNVNKKAGRSPSKPKSKPKVAANNPKVETAKVLGLLREAIGLLSK